jgi:hypothetical protein
MRYRVLPLWWLLVLAALPGQAATQFSDTSPLAAWRSLDLAVLVERARAGDV